MIICHIRSDEDFYTLCGEAGESISTYHYMHHVLANRKDETDCCASLWLRLCPICVNVLITLLSNDRTSEHLPQ